MRSFLSAFTAEPEHGNLSFYQYSVKYCLKQSGGDHIVVVLIVVVVDVAIRVDIPRVVATVDSTKPRIVVGRPERTVRTMFRNILLFRCTT